MPNRDDNSLLNEALDTANEIQNLTYRGMKLWLDRNSSDADDNAKQAADINAAIVAAMARLKTTFENA